MKKLLALAAVLAGAAAFAAQPKYVFLFIGDGMSTPQRMVAEEFSRKAGLGALAMNALPFQATTRTCSANALVTDSAAAATAIACGVKTCNGAVGVDADRRPVTSCAAAAKAAGKKVGILTTVTITHATPAGFYAHRASRGDAYGIAIDLANSGFDLFAGGGFSGRFNDKKAKEYATCGNAYDYAARQGYCIVTNKADYLGLKPGCGKILTRFTDDALPTAIDSEGDVYPTLAELVEKAVELLDGEKGFFLMAEGGRIDWAGHANDAATNLRDVLALDDAVKVALAFLERHPDETLVVVTGDHETGGLSMGFSGTGYSFRIEHLANQTMSIGKFDALFQKFVKSHPDLAFDDVKPLLAKAFGFTFEGDAKKDAMVVRPDELAELRRAFDHDVALWRARVAEEKAYDKRKRYELGGACRLVLAHKCGISWSSGSHTVMPVMTTAKGCGAELFSGFMENDELGRRLARLCGAPAK